MHVHLSRAYADPESFVRGGPNLITIFFSFFYLVDEVGNCFATVAVTVTTNCL